MEAAPRDRRIWGGRVEGVGGLRHVTGQGGVGLGPPALLFPFQIFFFLEPGEPATVDVSPPPTSCLPLGQGGGGEIGVTGVGERRKELPKPLQLTVLKLLLLTLDRSTERQLVGASPAHHEPGRVGLALLVLSNPNRDVVSACVLGGLWGEAKGGEVPVREVYRRPGNFPSRKSGVRGLSHLCIGQI